MAQLTQQLAYLFHLERFEEIKPGLVVMHALLAELGDPHRQFKSIHVAGTNGKGSVAAILSSLLQHESSLSQDRTENGLPPTPYPLPPKIGRYTSPHLIRFNERIVINDTPITDGELAGLIKEVRDAAQRARLSPTFFEFTTAVAFLHLARQHVDAAVIEVGLGGDLDATNTVTPDVSIITNIGLDHTAWLGRTRRAIAARKAGIIKPGVLLVTGERHPDIIAYLADVCRQRGAPFYSTHRHLRARRLRHDLTGQTFTVSGTVHGTFTLPLLGRHQIDNALTALLVMQLITDHQPAAQSRGVEAPSGHGAPPKHPATAGRARRRPSRQPRWGWREKLESRRLVQTTRHALAAVRWPGRLQIFSRKPFILLDGAHNGDGVRALARFLDEEKDKLPPADVLLLGSKHDKDISALLTHIIPHFRRVILTEASYQPLPAAELAARIAQTAETPGVSGKTPRVSAVTVEPNLPPALALACHELQTGRMLLITGSLYLVGDALALLAHKPTHGKER